MFAGGKKPRQCSDGIISSTRLREMLRDGKVKDAAAILGALTVFQMSGAAVLEMHSMQSTVSNCT